MDIKEYLKQKLNESQFEAAVYDGNSLILAGAGSGKTRTLTYKIAYLILGLNYNPENILAVTFTNKAANEMKERILQIAEEIGGNVNLISDNKEDEFDFDDLISGTTNLNNSSLNFDKKYLDKLWIGTFHSIFLRILKQDIDKLNLGYNHQFTIYDSSDSQSLIKQIIKDMKIADSINEKDAKVMISKWKNKGWTWQRVQQEVGTDTEVLVSKIYEKYQKQLQLSNALDFDDLLLLPYILFNKEPKVLEKWSNKFKQILVDEAQDTNWIQFELIKLLSGKGNDIIENINSDNHIQYNDKLGSNFNKVTFIGDDFQSIYGWRGAEMENFLNVKNWWPDIKIFKLEINYRSRPHIVEAGNCIIKNNIKQYEKNVKAYRDGSDYIRIFEFESEMDEAVGIIKLIKNMHDKKGYKWGSFAILYRTNAQSQPFEQVLLQEGIPYKVWGGFKFFERKEIKDILAYLKYLWNPKDNISLKRIINTPNRKIGATTVAKIENYAIEKGISLDEVISNIDFINITGLGPSSKNNIKMFVTTMKFIKNQMSSGGLNLTEFIKNLLSTIKYKDYLIDQEGKEKAEERWENISQLINMAGKFDDDFKQNPIEGLRKFLEEISLLTDLEDQQEDGDGDFVKLMTIHASKGLEFPVVFIVGLEENVFPLSRAKFDEKELEEERRLMYVAITRAKDLLFLSYANSRQKWGNITYNKPSRFIKELPENILRFYTGEKTGVSNKDLSEGDIVKHKLYGKGKILDIWKNIAIVKFFNPAFGSRKVEISLLEKVNE